MNIGRLEKFPFKIKNEGFQKVPKLLKQIPSIEFDDGLQPNEEAQSFVCGAKQLSDSKTE